MGRHQTSDASAAKGAYDNEYVHTVHFSTQVMVEELPLDRSSLIYTKLMTILPAATSLYSSSTMRRAVKYARCKRR
jgi:hypothetical protein